MTMTFPFINNAKQAVIYVIGASKKETVKEVFGPQEDFEKFPIQAVGTPNHPALWILDNAAALLLSSATKK